MKSLVLQGHERPVTKICFNTDGDLLFTCGKDGQLNGWLILEKKKLGRYNTGRGVVWSCDVSLDSKELISASADSKVYIFNTESGEELHVVQDDGPVKCVEWCKLPGRQDKFVIFHDALGTKSTASIKVYKWSEPANKYDCILKIGNLEQRCTGVRWGPFDETLISTHEKGFIYVWDAESGNLVKSFQAHQEDVTDMTLSQDRLLMLTCSKDASAALWDTAEFRCIKTYQTDRPLNGCAISPLWNHPTNPRPHIVLGGGQSAQDVTTTAASEGKFQALIYHMVQGHLVGSLNLHFSPINSVSFSPDGLALVTGAEEGIVKYTEFDDQYKDVIEA